jgi:hypothetical protein
MSMLRVRKEHSYDRCDPESLHREQNITSIKGTKYYTYLYYEANDHSQNLIFQSCSYDEHKNQKKYLK